VRAVATRDHQAPQGPRARRPHQPQPRWTDTAVPARAARAPCRRRVARSVSHPPGGAVRGARRGAPRSQKEQVMNKLEVSVDVPEEIRFVRTFDAPRRLVIRAMSEPELIKRWQGGKRSTVESVEIDY